MLWEKSGIHLDLDLYIQNLVTALETGGIHDVSTYLIVHVCMIEQGTI